jgi:hypothetical protein
MTAATILRHAGPSSSAIENIPPSNQENSE